MKRRVVVSMIVFVSIGGHIGSTRHVAAQSSCQALKSLELTNATVTSATEVAAGEGGPGMPAGCRVIGVSAPTSDSRIGFEVWLPLTSWNGKFQQVGNGGFAGSIPTNAMRAPLMRGYAVAATDDGHQSEAGTDASWALGHPEKVIDFGYRAVHETSLQANAIIKAFYGKAPTHSYFVGCSDGGREALMEAQRYPEDFGGIVAGAPANYFTRLLFNAVWVQQALAAEPGSAIPPEKLSVLQTAALAQCDTLDRVKDGIISHPKRCTFDPATVQCKGADGPDCLTAAQVTAAKKIYSGPKNPRTGQQILPGYTPGTEAIAGTWGPWLTGVGGRIPLAHQFAKSFFSSMVFEDANWDFRSFNFDSHVDLSNKKTAHAVNSDNPDLTKFRARGGKLIQYHGWADAAVTPYSSIEYFDAVQARMAPKGGGTGDFYRLFLVPGLAHCFGGVGATEVDVVTALDRWVHDGVAPDHLIATATGPADPARSKMARPVCPYPQVPEYRGTGDTNDAANFVCR